MSSNAATGNRLGTLGFVAALALALQPLEALAVAIVLASREEGKLATIGTAAAVVLYVLYPGLVAVISNRSTRPNEIRALVAATLLLVVTAGWWYASSHPSRSLGFRSSPAPSLWILVIEAIVISLITFRAAGLDRRAGPVSAFVVGGIAAIVFAAPVFVITALLLTT